MSDFDRKYDDRPTLRYAAEDEARSALLSTLIKKKCVYCGRRMTEERIEQGFDFCTKTECRTRGRREIKIKVVHVDFGACHG